MAGKSGSPRTQTLLVRSLRTSGKCQNLQAHPWPISVGALGSGPRDRLPQPRHRRLPARRRPPGGRRRRRALLTASSTPRPSRPWRSPSAGSRLPAGRDQPFRREPRLPRLRCGAAPPGGAAQSGPRAPGRAAGPAGAGPRGRPAAQPAREPSRNARGPRPVPGTGPADEVRHQRPRSSAVPAAARQLSATCRSTRAAPNCCSRSSPSETNTPRSGSGPTFRSAEWGSVFGAPPDGRRNR